jgi:dynein intermediate chain
VELTEEQVSSIVASEEFSSFFDRTSKLIEKALHEKSDFIRDYTLTDEVSDKDNNGLTPMISFSDDRWTSGRTCTALEWSPKVKICIYFLISVVR